MASIKDVAKKAQVSISTASLAFNNPERVSEATRKKIYQAMRELEYIPASIAKKNAFKERKRKSVAVITGSLVGPFWFEILRGISETLSIHKIEMVLFSGNDSFEKHFNSLIRKRECQGIILVSKGSEEEELLQIAIDEAFPVVICNPISKHPKISSIMVDNWNIGQLVANYFMQLGRKEIAIFGECPGDCTAREAGFLETLEKNRIKVPEKWKIRCNVTEEDAYRTASEFIQKTDTLPDAIFGVNDETAVGVIVALSEHDIAVPKQISVIGCDNLSIGRFVQPLLTTIETPKFEIGILAVHMLLRRVSGMPPENVVLNGKLIIRESCIEKQ